MEGKVRIEKELQYVGFNKPYLDFFFFKKKKGEGGGRVWEDLVGKDLKGINLKFPTCEKQKK